MSNASQPRKSPYDCISPTTKHVWNEQSGWCDKGCGNRDDGRVVSRWGDVIRQGPLTHAPLWKENT